MRRYIGVITFMALGLKEKKTAICCQETGTVLRQMN